MLKSLEKLYYTRYEHMSIFWVKGPGQGQGQGQGKKPSLEARGYALLRLKTQDLGMLTPVDLRCYMLTLMTC